MSGTGSAPSPPLPFGNSYWVVPGALLAGGYPGRRDPDKVMRNILGLLDAGIRDILSLMEMHEVTFLSRAITPYESELPHILHRENRSLGVTRIPIEDRGVPSPRTMVEILDTLDDCIHRGRSVFVHCLGGRGRTGTVIGCYLVRHGMDGQSALRQIEVLRWLGRTDGLPSPETRSQRGMVLAWERLDPQRTDPS